MRPYLIFKTERLAVRRYTESDRDNFHSLSGDEDVMRYIRPVQTREQSDSFLKENILFYDEYPMMGRWAVEEKLSGKFVGSFAIIFIPKSDNIQLGYSLLKQEWGKGYATELTKAGLKYVFNAMELPLVYAITEIDNIASQKVLVKAGFVEEIKYADENKQLIRFILQNPLKAEPKITL